MSPRHDHKVNIYICQPREVEGEELGTEDGAEDEGDNGTEGTGALVFIAGTLDEGGSQVRGEGYH